jgi:hypothetical protein
VFRASRTLTVISTSRTPERNTARTARARDPTGPFGAIAGRLLTTASGGRAARYDDGALAGGGALLSDGAAAGGVLDIEPELSDGAAAGGAAGGLLCEEAGGAAAGSVPEESVFAHAVSSSAAAASALRATLVFIDRYPDALLREPIRRKRSERLLVIVPRVPSRTAPRDFIESPCDWKQPGQFAVALERHLDAAATALPPQEPLRFRKLTIHLFPCRSAPDAPRWRACQGLG